MTNNNFKKALSDSINEEYNKLIPEMEMHTFSPEFEKKMKKLIHRRKKPYYKFVNTVGKRAACITAAFILASSTAIISVEALRTKFPGFFINTKKTHSTIKSEDKTNCPETIEEIYGITYDLNGFTVDFKDYDKYNRNITYKNRDIQLSFEQHAKLSYDEDINTEDAVLHNIEINGSHGIYFLDNHNYDNIIWDNGDYVFLLSSNIGKNELIEIAESVQKVETE